ncbi:leucine rich repeat protein [Cyclospora cayetanensis]|uniref:Leucine-rich repeat-containing protein 51 n=1 Tax=Cyclospora cayetanensis TaxID=88456 RepID=A0A1D3CWJ2_9EIME|nr:leucine rich repeat protein [Cyclospora cayetanensis]
MTRASISPSVLSHLPSSGASFSGIPPRERLHTLCSPGPPIDLSFKGISHVSEIAPVEEDVQQPTSAPGCATRGSRPVREAHHSAAFALDSAEGQDGNKGFMPFPHRFSTKDHIGAQVAGESKSHTGGLLSPSLAPIRKSICLTKSDRVVSICCLSLRDQQCLVSRETKPAKMFVNLVPTAVRLNNNELSEVPDLHVHLLRVLPRASENLRWLDLSFNKLKSIPSSLDALRGLACLYLHCNEIQDPAGLLLLRQNANLKFLTLLGNPCCNQGRSGEFR